jgi:Asp-tRNA(Asn)/Glu-tRNA(Gln) amidotransferase A subunit family amidase
MTIEADLFTVLSAVTPRVFPDFAPVDTTRPYVTYQQIGGLPVNYVNQELADNKNGEFQINVWGDTRMEVSALMLQIEAALRAAAAFVAEPMSQPVSDYDHDVPVYGARQDWTIWSER